MAGKTKPLILIVGACNPIADSLAVALRRQGDFKAIFVDWTEENLIQHFESGIALILLDGDQRGINRCESVKRLAAQFPTSKIVLMCAGLAKADALAVLRAGARGYLPKLTPVALMAETLSHILDGEIYLPTTFGKTQGQPVARHYVRQETYSELEAEILRSIMRSMSNREIAPSLEIPESKVKRMIRVLLRQLKASSRTEGADAI